jgi:hypothetical protein
MQCIALLFDCAAARRNDQARTLPPECVLAKGRINLEADKGYSGGWVQGIRDARCKPRFTLATGLRIISPSCGELNGRTIDISESGLGALLKIEVSLGERVKLEFAVPFGSIAVDATVRQRNAFRYGFQFVESNETVRRTCRSLEMEQCLKTDPEAR